MSSHSVVLLLIFYFSIPEVAAAHEAGLDRESPGYIDQGCWYGEWLMRLMQWLSEFPFSDVGIAVEPMSYVPLTDYGYGMLIMGECDPGLPDVTGESNVLHIEDPFNKDPVDPTRDPHLLLDHIMFTQGLVAKDALPRIRSGAGLVEHAIHERVNAMRPKNVPETSDHRPVSVSLTLA